MLARKLLNTPFNEMIQDNYEREMRVEQLEENKKDLLGEIEVRKKNTLVINMTLNNRFPLKARKRISLTPKISSHCLIYLVNMKLKPKLFPRKSMKKGKS